MGVLKCHIGMNGKRFVERADENLTAFIELELAIHHKVKREE